MKDKHCCTCFGCWHETGEGEHLWCDNHHPWLGTRVKYSLKFIVPIRPPSVNSLYNVFRYGKKLEVKIKPEVVKFKSEVKQFIPPWRYEHKGELICFSMTFFDLEYFFKNGKLRKFDITNTEKALLDAICEKIGIDDSFVKHRILQHKHSLLKDYMEIEVGVMASDPLEAMRVVNQ